MLSCIQLIVTTAALIQHLYSLAVYQHIFFCTYNEENITRFDVPYLLQCDIIIFDVGLFYKLWSLPVCIAVQVSALFDIGHCDEISAAAVGRR